MGIDGKYAIEGQSKPKMSAMISIKTEDGVTTGSVFMMGKTNEIKGLEITGNSFKGVCHASGMKVKLEGRVDGDDITGKIDAGLIKNDFIGKRQA
jgi:hypothetical protein